MSKFTCLACRVQFVDADLQRDHYKSEWHRYNLKRKVAQLPPLAQSDFEVLEQQQKQANETPSNVVELYCECCRKSFQTSKAFDQHNSSKKHLSAVKLQVPGNRSVKLEELLADVKIEDAVEQDQEVQEDDDDSDWESMSGDEEGDYRLEDAIKNTCCLFCPVSSETVEANVSHMMYRHSFFIPDAEYLTDLEGLISYLGEKVGCGLRCLWCCDKGKAFGSVLAVQRHMVSKGHCKMRMESGDTLLEYASFYDFSSSYPVGEDGKPIDPDQEVSGGQELRIDDGMNLVLPSGETVGHRSLLRFFRQNLRETPLLPPKRDSRKAILHDLLAQYRAIGWTGSSAKAAAKKHTDLQFLQKRQLNLAMAANKLPAHMRDQTRLF